MHSITRRTADRPPGTISTAPSAGRVSQVLHDSPLEGSGFEPSVPVRSGSFRPPLLGAVKVPIPPQGPPLTNRNRTAAASAYPAHPLLRLSMKLVPADFSRRAISAVCKSVRCVGKRRPNIRLRVRSAPPTEQKLRELQHGSGWQSAAISNSASSLNPARASVPARPCRLPRGRTGWRPTLPTAPDHQKAAGAVDPPQAL